MKRALSVMLVLACAAAQTSREAYRAAYRAWREGDPNLEHDAGSAGASLDGRAQQISALAAAYGAARSEFFQQVASAQERRLGWLTTPPGAIAPLLDENAVTLAAVEDRSVKRAMDSFAADPDAGIRELRGMLGREDAALTALGAAMEQRRRAAEEVRKADAALGQSQLAALDSYKTVDQAVKEAGASAGAETVAWAEYYRLLADGSRGVSAGAAATASSATPVAVATSPKANMPPLPLARYTGAWIYPVQGGLFHGAQPEFVDLVVHEENGHADGTLFARFKLPPGSAGDAELRFDFSGDFENSRNQVFNLLTSEGAKGTIELIPGPAFNLLEINFQTEARPGKVHQGNAVLVKK